jgi:hypothetical protein
VLNGELRLHGVDVERLAAAVLHEAIARSGFPLREHQREDLLADLVAYTWELSLRYDPDLDHARARGRQPGFDGWATQRLRFRVIDWIRQTEGRTRWAFSDHTYERSVRSVESWDGLDEADQQGSVDAEAHSDLDLGRVLLRGDSRAAWEVSGLGVPEDERTKERAA